MSERRIDYVRMAQNMEIVPELKQGVPWEQQTARTRWALHVLRVLVKDADIDTVNVDEVRREFNRVFDATVDLFPAQSGA
jgi:hypothetical protein